MRRSGSSLPLIAFLSFAACALLFLAGCGSANDPMPPLEVGARQEAFFAPPTPMPPRHEVQPPMPPQPGPPACFASPCPAGMHFNSSPEVCACVEDPVKACFQMEQCRDGLHFDHTPAICACVP
jgi:hypothetical protein